MLVGQSEIRGGGTLFDTVAGNTFGGAQVHYAKLPVEEQHENSETKDSCPENYIADEPDTFHN
jgi:hypothetical protein